MAQLLSLHGKPEPASANVLSEHEIEGLDRMAPQSQAQLLLERSINHYRGANDQIATAGRQMAGKIKLDPTLNSLFMTALNSDDLRVRAAAIEIDLASRDLEKSSSTIDRLEPDSHTGKQGPRANALWDVGLLGNRGVQPERALQILVASVQDPNVNVRYWAVEGLAYLGTTETVGPLLQVFHDDPSSMIRERAACGLAQSGMLNERQRRSAVPRLLDFADDAALDAETHKWVFQALRASRARLCLTMRPPGEVGTRQIAIASGIPSPAIHSDCCGWQTALNSSAITAYLFAKLSKNQSSLNRIHTSCKPTCSGVHSAQMNSWDKPRKHPV